MACRGLAAGSFLGTIELRILLVQWADEAVAAALHTRLTVYIDGVPIETVGTSRILIEHHPKITNFFTAALMSMRLQFSDTKNVTCASTSSLANDVCKRLEGITVQPVMRCVSLGVGLGVGARRNARQIRKRLIAFRDSRL